MILYTILRGVEEPEQYEIVYVDEDYFNNENDLDLNMDNDEYSRFEKFLEKYDIVPFVDATLTIKNNMSEEEIVKEIYENFSNAKYSDELYMFLLLNHKEFLINVYSYCEADIYDWMEDIADAKEKSVEQWRKDLLN